MFIEDIISTLQKSGIQSVKIGKSDINILLYADDMIVLAYNVFDLQDKIDVLVKYFSLNNLQINLEKTKVVVFRLGNSRFVKPKVFWGDKEIEIVDSYTYLGVPFYGKMLYAKTANDFLVKGKRAQRELFGLFYKANINNLETRLTLFDSLVKSIVMYCCHIWGINFIDKIISFQMSFLRQLFRLPSYVPRWLLRIESCCKNIEVSLLKNVLNFWCKIQSKPHDSLIFHCYEFLMGRVDNSKMKYNWCRYLMDMLKRYDCTSLINLKLDFSDAADILIFKSFLSKTLSNVHANLSQKSILDMQSSSKNPLYKVSRLYFQQDPILNSNISWNLITLYVQLKAQIPRVTYKGRSVSFNAMNSYFDASKFSDLDNCVLCSLKKRETIFHVFFECPAYSPVRIKTNQMFNPESEVDLMTNIKNVSSFNLKMYFEFLGKMLAIRDQWMNDLYLVFSLPRM
jgi:hypothetical protein